MQTSTIESKCIGICENWKDNRSSIELDVGEIAKSVISQPYSPFFPKGSSWNGILVLGTAQNLVSRGANNVKDYVECLKHNPSLAIRRLTDSFPEKGNELWIAPWDNGYLKLAVLVAFPNAHFENCAVSNAVLWSQSINGRKDFNPKPKSVHSRASAELWVEMFCAMIPYLQVVVTAGSTAHAVVGSALRKIKAERDSQVMHLELWDPSGANAHLSKEVESDRADDLISLVAQDASPSVISRLKKYATHVTKRSNKTSGDTK